MYVCVCVKNFKPLGINPAPVDIINREDKLGH